jgi:hypothetical protein
MFWLIEPSSGTGRTGHTLLPNTRNTSKKKNAITYPQANTHYISTRQGRAPKKYTTRRATHNYYTQIKYKKTFYKGLIFNFNDLTF